MSRSAPGVRVCSPGIPLVSVGAVEPDVCVNCSNSHKTRIIPAACPKSEPSENQIFLLAFPSVLSPAGTSHCNSCTFKPMVCRVEFLWNVLNSSSFGENAGFFGLGSSGSAVVWGWVPGQPGCPGPAGELILVTQRWQNQNSDCRG